MEEIKVNKEGAYFFYDYCIGNHNGHMASIPNNPVLSSICSAHGVTDENTFAEFLRKVADKIENQGF